MKLETYIPQSQDITIVAGCRSIRAGGALLEAIEFKRDELRKKNENSPRECPEDLKEDYRYLAGMVGMANWVLKLPDECRAYIDKL